MSEPDPAAKSVVAATWPEFNARLDVLDATLDELEADEVDPASPQYMEAWADRNGYAANCQPGSPEPETGGGYVFPSEPKGPEAGG